MDLTATILTALAAAALLLLSAKLLSLPLPIALRAALNAGSGFLALFLVNATADVTGLSLGFNLFYAAIVGIFGVPGLGLLFLSRWVFT